MRRVETEAAALLWTAIEDDLPILQKAARRGLVPRSSERREVHITVGNFCDAGGMQEATVAVDVITGRRIIAEAERVIRERMIELGQLTPSEGAAKK